MKKNFDIENSLAIALSFISNPFVIISLAITLPNIGFIQKTFDNFILFIVISLLVPLFFYIQEIAKHKSHPLHFVSVSRNNRNFLYQIVIFCLTFNVILFIYSRDSLWVGITVLLDIFASIMYIINRYVDKISIHAAGYCFSVIYIIDKVNPIFVVLFVFLPVIFWARIKLHRHTWLQLLLGSVIGMIVGLISWTIK